MSNTRKTIEVIVSPQGETTVQTKGFAGSSCRDASKFIEVALGDRTAEKMTAEIYSSISTVQQTNLG